MKWENVSTCLLLMTCMYLSFQLGRDFGRTETLTELKQESAQVTRDLAVIEREMINLEERCKPTN